MYFQHDTLPDNTFFRLCELAPGRDHDDLVCTLKTLRRQEAPPYEALSYTWGDLETNHRMRCNGQDMMITRNLDVALRALRLTDEVRIIWVDQICINQREDATAERSQQVGIMAFIYSDAAMVNCWLGPDRTDQARLAAYIITKLAHCFDQLVLREDNFAFHRFPDNRDLENLGLPLRESPVWAALNSMLNLPYFTRVWIVQEMVVAKQFQLLWGRSVIPGKEFRTFHGVAWRLRLHKPDGRIDEPAVTSVPIAAIMPHMSEPRQYTWRELMPLTGSLHCTRTKDRIFALIGIVEGTGYDISTDYSKSDEEVFADLTLQIVSVMDNLDILSYARIVNPSTARCPLWAPRWETSEGEDLLPRQNLSAHDFNATRNEKPWRGTTSNFKVLTLRGLLLDSVRARGSQVLGANFGAISDSYNMMMENEANVNHVYSTPFITPFVSTMVAGRSLSPDGLPDVRPGSSLVGFVAYLYNEMFREMNTKDGQVICQKDKINLIRLAQDADSAPSTQRPIFTPAKTTEVFGGWLEASHPNNEEAVRKSLETIQRCVDWGEQCRIFMMLYKFYSSGGRKFFITQQGYMGIGPACMETDDVVCCLYGGQTPYVVRQTSKSDEYLFLGECYVEGLMDGEALDMREKGTLTEQWFHLL